MSTYKPYISSFFKIAVGVLFIVSALLKLSSIDSFELYIFSLNLFSLEIASFMARLVIGAELALGVGYIINIYHKQLFYTVLATTVGFTLLLIYLWVIGREDNCHCFGDVVDISPVESILKNVGIIAMILLSKNTPTWRFEITINHHTIKRYSSYILLAACALIAVPFQRYPIHSIYNRVNDRGENYVASKINFDLLNTMLEQHPEIEWGTKCKIIAFYGTHCKYCKLSVGQLSQIVRRHGLDHDAIRLLFWGNDEGVADFFEQTDAVEFDYTIIEPHLLLNIISGELPTLLFYDPDAPHKIKLHNIRSIEEHDVVERLTENTIGGKADA
ncbi:MAG: DoxX family protein [Rikenellaceae bacterium]